jgi:nitrate reductase (cytochrome), electron transfer subunit
MKKRLAVIVMFTLLFAGGVLLVGTALDTGTEDTPAPWIIVQEIGLPGEAGAFRRGDQALEYGEMPEGNRSMSTYYRNRAYPGAPPTIPHPQLSPTGIGGKNCLQCHQNGGYTPQFQAWAPVTPHPEWLNCVQCHLPTRTADQFRESNWIKPPPPKLGIQALGTSPIIMPHGLQGRENCLSCHAGPAAPREIRVSHPERINCRQCHVPPTTESLFYKPEPLSDSEAAPSDGLGSVVNPVEGVRIRQVANWIRNK